MIYISKVKRRYVCGVRLVKGKNELSSSELKKLSNDALWIQDLKSDHVDIESKSVKYPIKKEKKTNTFSIGNKNVKSEN